MIAELPAVLTALQQGEILLQGQFLNGSNYTFMVKIQHQELEFTAVYKPLRGEQPLWDFPPGTLSKREVAAYLFSDLLGWELVPPTVFRRKGPLGSGSLQLYIEHDPEYHYFKFSDEDHERLRPVALFDLLINNADRKGGHLLKAEEDSHIWLIDHGICFHIEDKLRTVIWDFSGQPIPDPLIADLDRLLAREASEQAVTQGLAGLLRGAEINALLSRMRKFLANPVFPEPLSTRRSYPWPPV